MDTIETVTTPIDALVCFLPESGRPMCHQVIYQVRIDPEKLSPSGDYIRFEHAENCEIHGWKRVDEIQILEVLQTVPVEQRDAA